MSGEQVNEASLISGSSGPVTISNSNITIVAGESWKGDYGKKVSTRRTESDRLGNEGSLSQVLQSLGLEEKEITWLQQEKLFFLNKNPISENSKVFNGKQVLPSGCRDVAVKLIKFCERSKKEVDLLKKAHHPNIVQFYDAGEFHSWIYIVMELCAKSLRQYVEELGIKYLDMKTFVSIFRQLLDGLDYLHGKKILHRDIKPDNILVTESGEMKLSDFGIGKQIESERAEVTQTKYGAGSDGYRPPESYVENAKLTTAADIFSLALVVINLVSNGLHPYGANPYDWRDNIRKNRNLDLSIVPQHIPPFKRAQLIDLIAAMLMSEPQKRPSVKQIQAHDFFKDNLQASVPSPPGAIGTSTNTRDMLSNQHKPRLSKLVRKSGAYGFYLRSEAGQHGQFICDVESGGSAEEGGLRIGDKVIEVNGANVTMETHKAIVERIMEIENEVTLLVIDEVGEAYYKGKGVKIEAAMAVVKEIVEKVTVGNYCKAMFYHEKSDVDELELNIDDIILIVDKIDEGWWTGEKMLDNEKTIRGLFPANYVVELSPDEAREHEKSLQLLPASSSLDSTSTSQVYNTYFEDVFPTGMKGDNAAESINKQMDSEKDMQEDDRPRHCIPLNDEQSIAMKSEQTGM